MSHYDDYSRRYRNIAFERRGGVVQMRLHTNGGPLKWGSNEGSIHAQLSDSFHDLARDPDLRALILTGTGDVFCTALDPQGNPATITATSWARLMREGRELLLRVLDVEVPVIAAVNGPAHIHSELPVLADIVLAAETAEFADRVHFAYGVVPGDGVHVVWPLLLGPNRSRHFLLTGNAISAQEAQALGVVAEVRLTKNCRSAPGRSAPPSSRNPCWRCVTRDLRSHGAFVASSTTISIWDLRSKGSGCSRCVTDPSDGVTMP
jgi:enoyl-CoA hydratase/carnithine racemase